MDYLTVRAEIEAKELIKDMYKKIVEIDDNLDHITKSYYEMQEELSLLNDINPSKIRERAKEKLESWFYKHSLFTDGYEPLWGSSMDRKAIENIIVTYRKTNKKIYLKEEEG